MSVIFGNIWRIILIFSKWPQFVNRRFNLWDRRFIVPIVATSISSEIPIQNLTCTLSSTRGYNDLYQVKSWSSELGIAWIIESPVDPAKWKKKRKKKKGKSRNHNIIQDIPVIVSIFPCEDNWIRWHIIDDKLSHSKGWRQHCALQGAPTSYSFISIQSRADIFVKYFLYDTFYSRNASRTSDYFNSLYVGSLESCN